jgi:hypothetical protein
VALSALAACLLDAGQYWSGAKNRWPAQDPSVHLASVLSAAGVYTAAFPATDWLQNVHGVLRGFERNQLEGDRLPGSRWRWIDGRALSLPS